LAVQHYDCYSVAKLLLQNGCKNDVKNKKGQTPLDLASESGKKEMVKLFTDILKITKEYSVPEAVKLQDTSILNELIEKGAEVNAQTNDKSTGLHFAAQKGNLTFIQKLLEAKADPKIQDRWKKTPLHYAVNQNLKKDIAQALLKEGCEPHVADDCGLTALIVAIQNGANEIVDVLIKSKCSIDQKDEHGCTPLHKAAFFGHDNIVKLLLDSNCNVIKDKRGITPIELAKYWNYTEIVNLLNHTKSNTEQKK